MAKRLKFVRGQMQHIRRLLHMKYTPAELAQEIDCATKTVYRRYIPEGCPCERDASGRLWIVGDKFRDWALAVQHEAIVEGRARLAPDEAYCLSCKRATKVHEPIEIKPVGRHIELMIGRCANCGAVVSRGRKRIRAEGVKDDL